MGVVVQSLFRPLIQFDRRFHVISKMKEHAGWQHPFDGDVGLYRFRRFYFALLMKQGNQLTVPVGDMHSDLGVVFEKLTLDQPQQIFGTLAGERGYGYGGRAL